jgi:5-(carboxyamino)imidazole ribonucleotide synthase
LKKTLDKRIGIIGGGQLGKMMILEAKRLGLYVVTLDPSPDCPSHSISDEMIVAGVQDEAAIRELAGKVDVITYEWELINAEALAKLESEGHAIYPSAASLLVIQDKLKQKAKLHESGIKVPGFLAIDSLDALRGYAGRNGYPVMLKSRKEGYDGKGTFLIRNGGELEAGYNAMGGGKSALMVEEFVDYLMEVSVIATRGIGGEKVVYPIPRNEHENSILNTSTVPAGLSGGLHARIVETAVEVMDVFGGVGTFGVEMFLGKNGEILINEVAPRPHNSGHFTIEGCRVNQFENHIRAILGLPLGSTELLHNAVIMRNLLGQSGGRPHVEGLEEAYKQEGLNIHIYGKGASKTARKMGHYTITADSLEKARDIDAKTAELVKVTGV